MFRPALLISDGRPRIWSDRPTSVILCTVVSTICADLSLIKKNLFWLRASRDTPECNPTPFSETGILFSSQGVHGSKNWSATGLSLFCDLGGVMFRTILIICNLYWAPERTRATGDPDLSFMTFALCDWPRRPFLSVWVFSIYDNSVRMEVLLSNTDHFLIVLVHSLGSSPWVKPWSFRSLRSYASHLSVFFPINFYSNQNAMPNYWGARRKHLFAPCSIVPPEWTGIKLR